MNKRTKLKVYEGRQRNLLSQIQQAKSEKTIDKLHRQLLRVTTAIGKIKYPKATVNRSIVKAYVY